MPSSQTTKPAPSAPFFFDLSQQNQTSAPINVTNVTLPVTKPIVSSTPPAPKQNATQSVTILHGGSGGGGGTFTTVTSNPGQGGGSSSSSGGIGIAQNSLTANPNLVSPGAFTTLTQHFVTTPITSDTVSKIWVVQPNGDICGAKQLPAAVNSAGDLSRVFPTDFTLISGVSGHVCSTNQAGIYRVSGQISYAGLVATSAAAFNATSSSGPNVPPPIVKALVNATFSKTANVTNGNSPLPVQFTYNETNLGNIAMFNVTVMDDMCTPVIPGTVPTLPPGKSTIFTCNTVYSLVGVPTKSFTNHATATAHLANGTAVVLTANTTVSVSPQIRTFTLNLTEKPSTHLGQSPLQVRYTYVLNNTAPEPFTSVSIADDHCPSPIFVSDSDSDGMPSVSNPFEPRESLTFKCGPVKLNSTTTSTVSVTANCLPLCVDIGSASANVTVHVLNLPPVAPLSPIPSPSSCSYVGRPAEPLSQTAESSGNYTFVKQAEKNFYDCVASGFPDYHFILDTTAYTSITMNSTGITFNPAEVVCGKVGFNATPLSCELMPVATKLAPTHDCLQLALLSPQEMNTVRVQNGSVTVESQKEIFRCSTPSGPVIQDVIIWDFIGSTETGEQSFNNYAVETCQMPVTSSNNLPVLACVPTGPAQVIPLES